MKKEIALLDKKIVYILKKSKRARRMRLAVYCDGSITVTTPFDLKESVAEKFIKEKTNWLFSKIAFFKQFEGRIISRYSRKDYLKYKDKAYKLVVLRVDYFNKILKLNFNKINIKNQKTCWGSCSKKGNLNFNYKIAFLPKQLSDYIIAHELCHLKEFNHSKRFWALVEKVMPNYLDIKKELRNHELFYK